VTPIVIELAGEPQGKGRPRFVRSTGHAFTPAATRKYESALRLAAQGVMAGRTPIEGAVDVEVLACMPIPTSWSKGKRASAITGAVKPTSRPDVDNLVKVLDAFNEIVWRDDKQVVSCRVAKVYSEKPCLRVEIRAAA
jgi:Holliday junction resolvase RusA-like endonuclease